jgi:hypothetical protein
VKHHRSVVTWHQPEEKEQKYDNNEPENYRLQPTLGEVFNSTHW